MKIFYEFFFHCIFFREIISQSDSKMDDYNSKQVIQQSKAVRRMDLML